MGASWAFARSWLRGNVASTVLLTVLVAVVVAAAGGAFAGARRTASVLDRFVAHSRAPDLQVYGDGIDLDAVTSLPQVVGWNTGAYGLLSAEGPGGGPFPPGDVNPFITIELHGERSFAPLVVEGAEPAVDDAGGVAIDEEAAARLGAGVGDELTVRLFRPDQIGEVYENGEEFPAPRGAETTVVVTGIVRQVYDLNPGRPEDIDAVALASSELYFRPGFWERWGDEMAAFGDGTDGVELLLRDGAADVPAVEAALRAMPAGDELSIETRNDIADAAANAERATRFEAAAVAFFGVLALVVGTALVGQAMARQIRSELGQRQVLAGMGLTSTDVARATALRMTLVGAAGAALGMLVGVGTSAITPIGFAADAEIDPGLRFDALPIAGVGVFALVGTLLWSAWVGWRVPATPLRRRLGLGGTLAQRAGRAGAPVGVVAGLSHLSATRDRTPVRSSLGAVTFALGAVVAVAVYATSMDRFIGDPVEQGWSWDLIVGDSDDPDLEAAGRGVLAADERVTGHAGIWGGYEDVVTVDGIGGRDVAAMGVETLSGDTYVALTDGRPATAADEVVLGPRTARDAGVGIGDDLRLEGPRGPSSYEVVGTAVLHEGVGSFDLDDGIITSRAGLERLFGGTDVAGDGADFGDGVILYRYMVDVVDDVPLADVAASFRDDFGPTVIPHVVPVHVASLRSTSALPVAFGVLVAVLGTASLLHLLLATVRRRRREFAVLAALGASRRQLRLALATMATATVTLAAVVGLPVGIVAGRSVWSGVVRSLGGSMSSVVPMATVAVLVGVLVLLANAVAAVPGRRAARIRPADALRAE